ncbi:lipocalin family protein [Agromyces sp. SYSU T00266]|uniref:lipocalin family protein n=1 Tax=Agromyces zhanjiangensis TaxID=3158562 RepID=UPI003397929C
MSSSRSDQSLIQNLGTPPSGASPEVDIASGLLPKGKDATFDSWFAIGHFEAEGHTISFLVHIMTLNANGVIVAVNGSAGITDETTGWVGATDVAYPAFRAKVAKDRLSLVTPNSSLGGDLHELRARAKWKNASIDVTMRPVGYPLYNKGTGRFDLLGMDVRQYSLPTLQTTGTVTIDGREFTVEGTSWFDRQWQRQGLKLPGKWTWMDLNLDNGWRVSLWDAIATDGTPDGWATVIDESGNHTVTRLTPLIEDATDYWLTPKSGARYPTRWTVRLPDLDAAFEVVPHPREQEVKGVLSRYEGASSVTGSVMGEPVNGYCYVEMVGDWMAT